MRFAIAAADIRVGVFDAFIRAGWTPVKLFLAPGETRLDSNRAVIARAIGLKIPIQASRMTTADLEDLGKRECKALVVATYKWRVPDWRPFLERAVNFHPSPLPDGRGPYPTVQAILERRPAWGVTCHKLEHEFDTGDILDQELFPTGPDESEERLDLRVQMAATRLATRVANRFAELWDHARPQVGGSYWPRPGEGHRVMDFSSTVDSLLLQVRALGRIEAVASLSGSRVLVRRANGWAETHAHVPGTVVHVDPNTQILVVAARDGYVGLIDWRLDASAAAGLGAFYTG